MSSRADWAEEEMDIEETTDWVGKEMGSPWDLVGCSEAGVAFVLFRVGVAPDTFLEEPLRLRRKAIVAPMTKLMIKIRSEIIITIPKPAALESSPEDVEDDPEDDPEGSDPEGCPGAGARGSSLVASSVAWKPSLVVDPSDENVTKIGDAK
eukprot:CAMPEP_0184658992 /NCGR_PEP_ID=MMETSP0308-20130426/27707_1 /TAXON_ID=38269 /ORGANISM="Gloeochaete witrockiana, Strain SAG 46.84" /LENGTH=150 /DNA_ID=CAMNT_0027098425 /DNA_START=33 /DNA_END=488 /DNA_ORIENTATION=-